jgi:hypothetical protein
LHNMQSSNVIQDWNFACGMLVPETSIGRAYSCLIRGWRNISGLLRLQSDTD